MGMVPGTAWSLVKEKKEEVLYNGIVRIFMDLTALEKDPFCSRLYWPWMSQDILKVH